MTEKQVVTIFVMTKKQVVTIFVMTEKQVVTIFCFLVMTEIPNPTMPHKQTCRPTLPYGIPPHNQGVTKV